MIVSVDDATAVVLSSLAWFGVSFVVGWRANRWPLARVERTGPVTRLRRWEDHGRWWQRHLAVRRWKDRVPEAGALFSGGFAKRRVPSRATADLRRFRERLLEPIGNVPPAEFEAEYHRRNREHAIAA